MKKIIYTFAIASLCLAVSIGLRNQQILRETGKRLTLIKEQTRSVTAKLNSAEEERDVASDKASNIRDRKNLLSAQLEEERLALAATQTLFGSSTVWVVRCRCWIATKRWALAAAP